MGALQTLGEGMGAGPERHLNGEQFERAPGIWGGYFSHFGTHHPLDKALGISSHIGALAQKAAGGSAAGNPLQETADLLSSGNQRMTNGNV